MESILLLASCDIKEICDSTIVIVSIIACIYIAPILLQWITDLLSKIIRSFKKTDEEKPTNSPSTDRNAEKDIKLEVERQKRVLNLMQEICILSQDPSSSKEIKGKYNDANANKLWELYQKIDRYHKSIPTSSDTTANISKELNGHQ